MNYTVITDTCCDMPNEMYQSLKLKVVTLSLLYKGGCYNEFTDKFLKKLYAGLRAGEAATTSAVNPEGWAAAIEPELAQGKDVLVLAFSSGLSTTYQSAVIAANDLQEKYPQRKIRVIDTLCASMGQGLLVWHACRKRDEGMTLDALAAWCEVAKMQLCHWFTVDDLAFLKRGGRISTTTALLGTMLQIKPVLHMDNEGHLISMAKSRGRKASIEALAKKFAETQLSGENDTVFISHGDCLEDAQYLSKIMKETYGVKEVVISYVGAVIGSHSGPGTLALFFMGEKR